VFITCKYIAVTRSYMEHQNCCAAQFTKLAFAAAQLRGNVGCRHIY